MPAAVESRNGPSAAAAGKKESTGDFGILKISSIWLQILKSENVLTFSENRLFQGFEDFLSPKIEIWKISSNFQKISYFEGSKTFFLISKKWNRKIFLKKFLKFFSISSILCYTSYTEKKL